MKILVPLFEEAMTTSLAAAGDERPIRPEPMVQVLVREAGINIDYRFTQLNNQSDILLLCITERIRTGKSNTV